MIFLGGGNSIRRNLLALLIASPWIALALLRIFSLDAFWPLVPLVAFTPQVAISMLVPLAIALFVRAPLAATILVVLIAWLCGLILPRVIPNDSPSASGERVTILTANLLEGKASTRSLVRAIRNSRADIIALQEAGPIDLAELRAAGVLRGRPFVSGNPQPGTLGWVTISRWPLREVAGSGLTLDRWSEMRVVGTGILLRNLHPAPPVRPDRTRGWQQSLAAIPGPRGRTRIVVGDFNASLDHRAFRSVLARGYRDAGDMAGSGLDWTWSAGAVRRLVIDHVLLPPGVALESYRVFDLAGSDHNAVAATVRIR